MFPDNVALSQGSQTQKGHIAVINASLDLKNGYEGRTTITFSQNIVRKVKISYFVPNL